MNMSVRDYLDCLNCCRKAQPGSGWHKFFFGDSGLYKNRENSLTTKNACIHFSQLSTDVIELAASSPCFL